MDKINKMKTIPDTQLTRLAANFFQSKTQGEYSANDVAVVKEFFYYALQQKSLKKYKVALCFICINPNYWEFIAKTIEGARKFFLPEHQVDYFVWSQAHHIELMAQIVKDFPQIFEKVVEIKTPLPK